MLRKTVLLAAAAAALLYGATLAFPATSARLMIVGLAWSVGLKPGTVGTPAGTVHYLAGGRGETVLLLHGIFARKEHWIDSSRELLDGYRVVLIDLPGFGANEVLPPGSYGFDAQALNLAEAIDALGLETMHVAANSMGAQLAAMLAMSRPDAVRSLAFIGSPVGVTSPTPSDMELALVSGVKPLVVASHADHAARMDWLFPRAPWVPGAVARTWADEEVARGPDNLRIWDEVHDWKTARLEALAPQLDQPAFLLWCNQDRIFHVSGASVLAAALPRAEVVLLDGCGHLPLLDRPAESGRLYRGFLDRS